ncbi:MAG: NUDIX hydrolase [Proteobacteria bacterium]|nr:NUDIX hydrolase [Pseudomonadota bacterium]
MEFSAGGIVVKKDGGNYKILLCLQEKLSGQKVYCLPKGHIEKGETPENTALREVYEETGITATNPRFLDKIDYFFMHNQEKVKKTVYFYLMDYKSGDFQPNNETISIGWFDKNEAISLNPYSTEKKIIELAFQSLQNYQIA